MPITIMRKMAYEDTFIYIMKSGYCFQYLFSWEEKDYSYYLIMKPSFWKRLLYKFGIIKNVYTQDDLDYIEQALLSGAMASIDALIDSIPQQTIHDFVEKVLSQKTERIPIDK